jgi:Ala-tRNA(Pro) deacylase
MDVAAFLKEHKVKFELRHHPARYTAQEVAAAEHVTGEEVAKVVILLADGKPVMCVMPATYVVDMKKAKKALGAKKVELATEDGIGELFPDCQVGAMPPFGKPYDMPLYVEESLAEDEEILIPAGTHEDSVLLAWDAYAKLAEPEIASFGKHVD